MLRKQILAVMEGKPERKELTDVLSSEGYGVVLARTSPAADALVKSGSFGLVVVDVSSPDVDSLAFLSHYRDNNPLGKIIIVSRRPDFRTALQSLRLSAFDFLFDPFPAESFLTSVERAFEDSEKAMARFRAQVAEENVRLKAELERSNMETIMALAGALEARDEYTRGHSFRVSELAVRVGERMGLSLEDIRKLRYGGILHDIGKIGVDTNILNKKSPLSKDDFDNIYQHAGVGVRIVSSVESLKTVIPIIQYHHEAYEHLPSVVSESCRDFLLVNIVKVVDAYDAMVSDRPYRKALPVEMALTELAQYAGSEFHPRVVEELTRLVRVDFRKDLQRLNNAALFDKSGLALGYL